MNLKNQVENYFNKSNIAFIKSVPFNEIIFDERAKYFCKFGCKNFNRKYSCPPYSLSEYKKIKKNGYKWVILFATSYRFNEEDSRFKLRFLNNQKEYEIQRISQQLNNLISFNGHKNVVFSGGSCKKCRPCSSIKGEKCKKPSLKQISMEAVQIDCIKTLTKAGFDFQLTDAHSLNRCGCIFTNDKNLSEIYHIKNPSNQIFQQASFDEIKEYCNQFVKDHPKLYEKIEIIQIDQIKVIDPLCRESCKSYGKTFSCPPYSKKIDLKMWENAVIWIWKKNKFKKYRYNIALKKIHQMLYSLGHYFAISIRDCLCDECSPCSYSDSNNAFCQNRKILSPSMQSQGIDPSQFGSGKFGIELF